MRTVLYRAIPWNKEDVLLALESGVDGLICPDSEKEAASKLARCIVLGESEVAFITLSSKKDEEHAAELAHEASRLGSLSTEGHTAKTKSSGKEAAAPRLVLLKRGWEIIPLENLLAGSPGVAVEAGNREEAVLAAGVLERGADVIVLTPEATLQMKDIITTLKYQTPNLELSIADITSVTPVGMGHRVCVDTASLFSTGQGMLIGNSAAFTFLVNAETERNEYVASRPFRINAGGVHAYAIMPDDRTAYLEELSSGSEVLIVNYDGSTSIATVGRVKTERRPMLLVEATLRDNGGKPVSGAVFLQNAETIRLVRPDGTPISVVDLKPGDAVLCKTDVAGRHFGMRITEDIKEG